MDNKITVFEPHGFVRLVDYSGSELSIANAARVSLHKEAQWYYRNWWQKLRGRRSLSGPDKGLINFLLKEHHGSPFEQGFMAQWHVRVPIFVAREWVRHRIGYSYNEESGRYVELRPDFYIPELSDVRSQYGKPGSYTFKKVNLLDADWFIRELTANSRSSYNRYKEAIRRGIAKEQARMLLPVNLYTEIRWTCNARSMLNFFTLRSAKDAQFEIRQYSLAMEKIFAREMPNVYKAYVSNGSVAP